MSKRKAIIKIKPNKYANGEVVKVNLMVMHPMETGMRKDKETKATIPAHYINNVKFVYNGKVITTMNVWESLSTNPVFTTYMKIDGEGELSVTFTDNTGEVNEKSIKITPKG
ncbi:MAG: thiosulfate oxidation carrier complex protein SoxZ [Epsilonproteobacteria bacterium]|nr:thiosulfate oxidation carrier complex protein SoxZ [Campylobacterota bacterium]